MFRACLMPCAFRLSGYVNVKNRRHKTRFVSRLISCIPGSAPPGFQDHPVILEESLEAKWAFPLFRLVAAISWHFRFMIRQTDAVNNVPSLILHSLFSCFYETCGNKTQSWSHLEGELTFPLEEFYSSFRRWKTFLAFLDNIKENTRNCSLNSTLQSCHYSPNH